MTEIILTITTLFSALMAGLFFAFTFSVMPGLGKLPDAEFIKAMQSINKAIQNPIFFICFFGILIFLPLSTYSYYSKQTTVFWLLLIATVIYFIGVFGVTVFGNIPLNSRLDKFNTLSADAKSIMEQRILFEISWNRFNAIRTVCSILSLVLVIIGCVNSSVTLQHASKNIRYIW